jgi:hypothetical protein
MDSCTVAVSRELIPPNLCFLTRRFRRLRLPGGSPIERRGGDISDCQLSANDEDL